MNKKGTLKLRCGGWTVKKHAIRQNSVFFRLMDFKKWFIHGVVNISVFVNSNIFLYNCIKNMQVLTGQYPTLYTHKFAFDFTDFKHGTLKYNVLDFLTIPKGQQVVSVAYKQLVTFDGVNMGTPTFRVFQKNIMPAYPSAQGQFMAVAVNQSVSLQQGAITQQMSRTYPNANNPPNVWCNYLSPTTLTARVEISGTGNMSGLSAGSFWVWVTVMGFK